MYQHCGSRTIFKLQSPVFELSVALLYMQASAQWTHALSPFLIKFPRDFLGVEGIRYYGLAYLASFLIVWALLSLYNKRRRIDLSSDQRSSLMTALILGVVIRRLG